MHICSRTGALAWLAWRSVALAFATVPTVAFCRPLFFVTRVAYCRPCLRRAGTEHESGAGVGSCPFIACKAKEPVAVPHRARLLAQAARSVPSSGGGALVSCTAVVILPQNFASLLCQDRARRVFADQAGIAYRGGRGTTFPEHSTRLHSSEG